MVLTCIFHFKLVWTYADLSLIFHAVNESILSCGFESESILSCGSIFSSEQQKKLQFLTNIIKRKKNVFFFLFIRLELIMQRN